MTFPEPFRYSSEPHQRRYGPSGYENYQEYKPWLRDEFIFRCVYCLGREVWYPSGAEAFSVDHVVPKSRVPALICAYENLVYACVRCNSLRGEVELLDPANAAFAAHLTVSDDGVVHALGAQGQDIIDQLHLNSEHTVDTRRYYLTILRLKQRQPGNHDIDTVFQNAFGYPKDLPDLTKKKPPSGNAREDRTVSCFHARRLRGELSATY